MNGSISLEKRNPSRRPLARITRILRQIVGRSSRVAWKATDEELAKIWTLTYKATNFSMPRTAVMRSMVISHLIHHRGQLGVYLRLKQRRIPRDVRPVGGQTNLWQAKTAVKVLYTDFSLCSVRWAKLKTTQAEACALDRIEISGARDDHIK